MPNDPSLTPPSLLEPESRGGDINEGGLSFQMAVLLAHLPGWLAMEGFDMLIREAVGDFEARFFVPGRELVKEFLEAKDHPVTPTEFWGEIERFRKIDEATDEFQWFTLVSTGLSSGLQPLINGMRRLRGPYEFYGSESPIVENSYKDYLEVVKALGRTKAEADFLFRKVQLEPDWSMARQSGAALFKEALCKALPAFSDSPSHVLDSAHETLSTFVHSRRNQAIKRSELEAKLAEFLPAEQRVSTSPVLFHTAIDENQADTPNELVFRWARFFGGEQRVYPPAAEWNDALMSELRSTKKWVLEQRSTRRIRLTGNRRLSACMAIGSVFSAVAGFDIEMICRDGTIWATDAHAKPETPAYALKSSGTFQDDESEHLVVSIGITRNISSEVQTALPRLGLEGAPTLHLHGAIPVVSAEQANSILAEIKSRIAYAVLNTQSKMMHVFIAAPAFLALLLGHRLNATAQVQCYEWLAAGTYVPTCRCN